MDDKGPGHNGNKENSPLPELRHWSDVNFLEWQKLSGDKLKHVNYIFACMVTNEETLAVVARIMQSHGALPAWPGVTFPPGSDEYHALIGSPIGVGSAWFLINHKEILGGSKKVGGIVVFAVDVGDFAPHLFILFKIIDV